MKTRYLLALATVLLVLGLLVGCSSSPYGNQPNTSRVPTTTTTASISGSNQVVTISGFAFSPPTLNVAKGTTITWTNNDSTTHTITSDNGIWDSGDVAPGKTYSRTFDNTGTFPYHCKIHTTMKAQVVVQ